MKFEPDQTYRAALLIGGLFLLALFILALAKGDRFTKPAHRAAGKAPRNRFGWRRRPRSLLHWRRFGTSTRSPCRHHLPLGKQRHGGDRGCELSSGRRHRRDSSACRCRARRKVNRCARGDLRCDGVLRRLSSVIVEEGRILPLTFLLGQRTRTE